MKLIMENWRKFLSEAPMQDYGPGSFTPKIPVTRQEVDDILSLWTYVEPTGQISDISLDTGVRFTYEDVVDDVKTAGIKLEDGDYVGYGIAVTAAILATLSMVPVVGKFSKGARAGLKAKKAVDKSIDTAKNTSKSLRASGDPKLIEKADEIDDAVVKANTKATAAGAAAKVGSKLFGNRLAQDHQGRLLVVMPTSKGTTVFMKSTGTSQIKILGYDGGKPIFASNDRSWVPVEGFIFGTYGKFNSNDIRFGTGAKSNKQVYQFVRNSETERIMINNHGRSWPRKIDSRNMDDFDPQVLDDLQNLYKEFPDELKKLSSDAKYPSPDSEFGKIASRLQKLEDNNQLIDKFGDIQQLKPDQLFDWVNNNSRLKDL